MRLNAIIHRLQFWRAQFHLANDIPYPALRDTATHWLKHYELEIARLRRSIRDGTSTSSSSAFLSLVAYLLRLLPQAALMGHCLPVLPFSSPKWFGASWSKHSGMFLMSPYLVRQACMLEHVGSPSRRRT